jgi:hypothetical protein
LNQKHREAKIIIDALNSNEDGDALLFKNRFRSRFCFDKSTGLWCEFMDHWYEDRLEVAIAAIHGGTENQTQDSE